MEKKKKTAKKYPKIRFRQTLFWDVDPKTIDSKKHAVYIIERILDFGNDDEVRWMWETYPHRLIKKVVATSRVLHGKTKALWSIMFT